MPRGERPPRTTRAAAAIPLSIAVAIGVTGGSSLLLPDESAAVVLTRDAVGATGASLDGTGLRLGFTLGLPSVGLSTVLGVRQLAGFWFPALPVPTEAGESATLPLVTVLERNRPNPFTQVTAFELRLAARGGGARPVSLEIFDLEGRRIRTLIEASLLPGTHRASWDGRDAAGRPVAAGVYFARLEAPDRRMTRKLVLAR